MQKILVFLLKTFWPSSGRNSIRVAAIRSLAVYNFCKNSNTLYLFFDCFKMLHRLTQSFTLCNSSTRNSSIDFHRLDYRVGRVLSLFSSRGNWDSPNPSPAGKCAPLPPVLGGGAHSLAREGLGESQFRRGENKLSTLVLVIYTYFVGSIYCNSLCRLFIVVVSKFLTD